MKQEIKEIASQNINLQEPIIPTRNRFFSLNHKQTSPSRSKSSKSSKSRYINDRLLPQKVSCNFFKMRSPSFSCRGTETKDINDILRQESSFAKYTNLLQMNIIKEEQAFNQNIFDEGPCVPTSRSQSRDKGNILFYQQNPKRYKPYILGNNDERLLTEEQFPIPIRRVPKLPFKILDAPRLKDDFYNSLLDWSAGNQIAIGLQNCVHTYNAMTNKSQELAEYDLPTAITSLSWCARQEILAVGDDTGCVKIFDVERKKEIRKYQNHLQRIGTLDWNGYQITSGGRDSMIHVSDTRQMRSSVISFTGHKQEVCGIKWSPSEELLASGGNDNRVIVNSLKMPSQQFCQFKDHVAAVKALAWSPHQSNFLASGGGTTDKCLKFWNVSQSCLVQSIDTGSQICNMKWSVNTDELVLTHGFSQNLISLWQVNKTKMIATLSGHEYRVLYLAMSPDGENIVTGSGDETLRFWKVFPPRKKNQINSLSSQLDFNKVELR